MFKQLKLRKQANIDYQQARGTAHKQLLQSAKQNLLKRKNDQKAIIQKAHKQIQRLEKERDRKLHDALTHHLVHDRITEVPGIGQARRADILRHIYKGKLTDLADAHKLPGIGEQTQAVINQWIRHYQKNFTRFLNTDFPGKSKIELSYKQKVQEEKGRINRANKIIDNINDPLNRIKPELDWLEQISAGSFYRKLKDPTRSTPILDRYIQGVFAEWEPMPDWFQEIIKYAQVTGQASFKKRVKTAVPSREPSSPYTSKELSNAYSITIFIVLLIMLFCCMFFVFLLSIDTDTPTPTKTATPTTTITTTPVPIDTKTPQPSKTPTATPPPTPSRTPTATVTATATATVVLQPQVQVNISAANVRAAPNADAAIIGVVRNGDILLVLGVNETETWYQVELPNGQTGWIGSSIVTLISAEEETP